MTNAGVIFDMDGVLVDTTPLCVDSTWRLLNRLGVHSPREELFSLVGISVSEIWGKLKSEFGIQKSIAELVQDQKQAQMNRILEMDELPPIPGIKELLIELNEIGLLCAVASSSPPELISLLLSKARLNGYFSFTVSGEDVPNGKPAPDVFLLAARKLNVNPASCLVIEDSPHGIEGAKAAGMATIGYKNPNSGSQDLSSADVQISDFGPLSRRAIISRLERAQQGKDSIDLQSFPSRPKQI